MSVRANRHYNNPAIGAAFSNLVSLFAPPSGADMAGYANARATQENADRLAALTAYARNPNFDWAAMDRMATAAGLYTPVQSMRRVDLDNATQRYGVDVGALTSRANNAADNATQRHGIDTQAQTSRANNTEDNQRALITSLFAPLDPGQIAPAVPEEFMGALGLPEVDRRIGAPATLSDSELAAVIIAGLSEDEQRAYALRSVPTMPVVGDDGVASIVFGPDAVGRQPFAEPRTSAPTNMLAVLPDGTNVPAIQSGENGSFVHAQTGMRLPDSIQIFNVPTPTGSAEDVGLTGSTVGRVERQIIATEQTLTTARQLRQLIQSSPSSQGLVGTLRGTAQDIVQTGGELGQFFGGELAEITAAVNSGIMDAGVAREFFDPSIPAIQMLSNLLAWQYAKSLSGERVSNEQLRAAREAIGGSGMFANMANSLTRLDQLIGSWEGQLAQLRTLAPNVRIGSGAPSSLLTQPSSEPFAPQAEPPRISSDADYEALPPGTLFFDPEGQLRRKP